MSTFVSWVNSMSNWRSWNVHTNTNLLLTGHGKGFCLIYLLCRTQSLIIVHSRWRQSSIYSPHDYPLRGLKTHPLSGFAHSFMWYFLLGIDADAGNAKYIWFKFIIWIGANNCSYKQILNNLVVEQTIIGMIHYSSSRLIDKGLSIETEHVLSLIHKKGIFEFPIRKRKSHQNIPFCEKL